MNFKWGRTGKSCQYWQCCFSWHLILLILWRTLQQNKSNLAGCFLKTVSKFVQRQSMFFLFLHIFFTYLPISTFYSLTLLHVAQRGPSFSPQYESFIVPCECSITYPSQLRVLAQMASFELLCEDHLQQTLKWITWRQAEISLNLSFRCTLQLLLFPTPQNDFISYTNC